MSMCVALLTTLRDKGRDTTVLELCNKDHVIRSCHE